MAGKKQSATKKTAQEIREMIACLEEAYIFLEEDPVYLLANKSTQREVEILLARINKLIGKPN